MIPGIDPKVDIAFKKLYGSDSWRNLTISLINAVLESFLSHPVIEVELLNPYSERTKLDDKLSLPSKLDRVEIRQAMEILKMLTQDELERELYEGRLKVKRDLQTLETLRRMAEQRSELLAAQLNEWQQKYQQLNREREAANREREAAALREEQLNREREAARRDARLALAERIGLCQRLLGQPVSPADSILEHSIDELRQQAERLEQALTERTGLQ